MFASISPQINTAQLLGLDKPDFGKNVGLSEIVALQPQTMAALTQIQELLNRQMTASPAMQATIAAILPPNTQAITRLIQSDQGQAGDGKHGSSPAGAGQSD